MKDYMQTINAEGLKIRTTVVPRPAETLVAVEAETADGRRVVVVWEPDGTGYPVVDDMTEAESDRVWDLVFEHMCAHGFWAACPDTHRAPEGIVP